MQYGGIQRQIAALNGAGVLGIAVLLTEHFWSLDVVNAAVLLEPGIRGRIGLCQNGGGLEEGCMDQIQGSLLSVRRQRKPEAWFFRLGFCTPS